MRRAGGSATRRGSGRRVALLLCLLAYLCTVSPLSIVPAKLGAWLGRGAAAGERFPCEGCGCGCASAHECWTNCCCHSLEERVGWARANGVRIPEGVRVPEALLTRIEHAEPPCALCATGGESAAPKASVRLVPSLSASRCKRIFDWWIVPPPLLAGGGRVVTIVPPASARPAPVKSERAPDSVPLDPATPPPRSVAAAPSVPA